jgi:hypothetical protein
MGLVPNCWIGRKYIFVWKDVKDKKVLEEDM